MSIDCVLYYISHHWHKLLWSMKARVKGSVIFLTRSTHTSPKQSYRDIFLKTIVYSACMQKYLRKKKYPLFNVAQQVYFPNSSTSPVTSITIPVFVLSPDRRPDCSLLNAESIKAFVLPCALRLGKGLTGNKVILWISNILSWECQLPF